MKKTFLAIFIVILMLFTQVAVFASDIDSNSASISPADKITDELKEVMSDTADGEYIPIHIKLNSYDDSVVYRILSQRFGETITADNEEEFIEQQIETKVNQYNSFVEEINNSQFSVMSTNIQAGSFGIQNIRTVCGISSVVSDTELTTCINEGMPIGEIVELSERNQFLDDWRGVRKGLNTAVNNAFVEKLNNSMYSDLYIDPALTRLTMNCKKEYINIIASFNETERIDCYINEIEVIEDTLTTTTSSFALYHMTEYGDLTYNGAGIKIGILEAHRTSSGTFVKGYDNSNLHLANKSISYRASAYDAQISAISSHATTVLSIVGGDAVMSNSNVGYRGVAPNATLSLTYVRYYEDFSGALDWFVNVEKVHIINYSGGSGTGYEAKCFLFDDYIQQYRVIFINSAGNNNSVVGPGSAYNGITVGNVGRLLNTGVYALLDGSAFIEDDNFTNKPDICAIGTNICMLGTSNNPENRGSGTSYSAPQVTGAIALMLQKDSSLIGNPHKVKAILLSSADEDAIFKEDDDPVMIPNPTTNSGYVTAVGVTREKTGAGLLNIEASIANTSNPMLFSYSYSSITSSTKNTAYNYYNISQGQSIKFGGVFEIDNDEMINSTGEAGTFDQVGVDCNISMNLRIIESNGTIVFDSNSSSTASWNDNVKMFTVTFASGGLYKFELYFTTKNGVTLSGFDNNVNAVMIVTCKCEEPLITKERESGGTLECIDCANCSYYLEEIWYGDVHEETLSTGTVSFVMQYAPDSLTNPTSIYCSNFSVEYQTNDSTKKAVIVPESGNMTYTPTGYTQYRSFTIMVLNSDGSQYASHFVDVTIEYDSFELTYYLYG